MLLKTSVTVSAKFKYMNSLATQQFYFCVNTQQKYVNIFSKRHAQERSW